MVSSCGFFVGWPAACLCVVARSQVVHGLVDEIDTGLGHVERCGATLAALSLTLQPEVCENPPDHGRVVDEGHDLHLPHAGRTRAGPLPTP